MNITCDLSIVLDFAHECMQALASFSPHDRRAIVQKIDDAITGGNPAGYAALVSSPVFHPSIPVGPSGHPSVNDLTAAVSDALAAYRLAGFPLGLKMKTLPVGDPPPVPPSCVKVYLIDGHWVIVYNWEVDPDDGSPAANAITEDYKAYDAFDFVPGIETIDPNRVLDGVFQVHLEFSIPH